MFFFCCQYDKDSFLKAQEFPLKPLSRLYLDDVDQLNNSPKICNPVRSTFMFTIQNRQAVQIYNILKPINSVILFFFLKTSAKNNQGAPINASLLLTNQCKRGLSGRTNQNARGFFLALFSTIALLYSFCLNVDDNTN